MYCQNEYLSQVREEMNLHIEEALGTLYEAMESSETKENKRNNTTPQLQHSLEKAVQNVEIQPCNVILSSGKTARESRHINIALISFYQMKLEVLQGKIVESKLEESK